MMGVGQTGEYGLHLMFANFCRSHVKSVLENAGHAKIKRRTYQLAGWVNFFFLRIFCFL